MIRFVALNSLNYWMLNRSIYAVVVFVFVVLPIVSSFDQCRSLSTTYRVACASHQQQHNLKIRTISSQCVSKLHHQFQLQANNNRLNFNKRISFPNDFSMIFNNNNNNIFNDDEYEEDEIQQDRVDEYLEFLERRYHRLHDEESYVTSNSGSIADTSTRLRNTVTSMEGQIGKIPSTYLSTVSSVYLNEKDQNRLDINKNKWDGNHFVKVKDNNNNQIGQRDSNKVSSSTSYNSLDPFENVLYVLGVAGLASQRLLQKHSRSHTANKHQQLANMHQQGSQNSVIQSSKRNSTQLGIPVKPSSTRLQNGREVTSSVGSLDSLISLIRGIYLKSYIHQYIQNQYKRRQLKLLMTTMLNVFFPSTTSTATAKEQIHEKMSMTTTTTKCIKAIWIIGGGKRNPIWTLNTMVVFVLYSTMAKVHGFGGSRDHNATQQRHISKQANTHRL